MVPFALLATTAFLSASVAAVQAPAAPFLAPRRTNLTANATTLAGVTPSSKLNWMPCHAPPFQCAYLTVPLDYKSASTGTTNIAFIRYLVNEKLDDLLYNPGGPGESGVEQLLELGPIFAKRWNFNPVSFDSRGVGFSGPKVACTNTNSTSLRRRELNALGDLTEIWNEALELSIACAAAMKRTNARYVGTSAVVQDMMQFTELQATARGKIAKTALINYYGISYGTVIGQTLVAMYPDRVNRILLDANVYSVAHYQGWEPNRIDDFGHAVFTFSKLCFEAGPRWCVLATGATSPQQVQARFDAALEELRLRPETAQDGSTFSDSTFLALVSKSMYSPRRDYAGWANATAWILATSPSPLSERDTPEAAPGDDGLYVITAIDIAGRYPFKTYEQWKAAAEKLEKTAPYFAYNYATTNGLIGLIKPTPPPPSQSFPGFAFTRPRAPILFINTVADHVTPTSSARLMSKFFAGSGLVIVNGPGHGYKQAPSRCADMIVERYMSTGKVPDGETWCQTDVKAEWYFGAKGEGWEAL